MNLGVSGLNISVCVSQSEIDTSERQQEYKVNNSALEKSVCNGSPVHTTVHIPNVIHTNKYSSAGFKRFSGLVKIPGN